MIINDGKGIYDNIGLIDSCVTTLCGLKISLIDMEQIGNPIIDVVNR